MSAIPKSPKISVEEYLALEEKAEFKSEFFDGEMFAMAGATWEHNIVKDNLVGELHPRLKGTPCRTVSSDQRLKVHGSTLYTYPDLMIMCGPVERDPLNKNTILNPIVIIEVLSPGTEAYDRGAKFRRFQKIPSVREIVLASQSEQLIQVFERQADDTWLLRSFDDPAGVFRLTSFPLEIPWADVYRGT